MEPAAREALARDMKRLHEGDREAFASVYGLVWPLVRRFAGRLLETGHDGGLDADADDVAQQALLKVFSRIMSYDPERDALPWILGIAYYECRTMKKQRLRQRQRQVGEEGAAHLAVDAPSPENVAIEHELYETVKEVMGELRPQEIETLRIVAEDLERPAIAASTFRKRFQRALERLRFVWRQRHGQ